MKGLNIWAEMEKVGFKGGSGSVREENGNPVFYSTDGKSPSQPVPLGRKVFMMPIPVWVDAQVMSLLDLGGPETTKVEVTTLWLWEDEAKAATAAFASQLKQKGLLE